LPQDYVVDVYLSVRLEAGSLHVANYLIRATFYYLYAKVILFPSSAKHSCTPRGKHLLLHGVMSGIHFLSSQIFSRSSRKKFDKMSFGATEKPS
jgi:hypothetical protein